jgi:hypothetical protein
VIKTGIDRIRRHSEEIGRVFVDGKSLADVALLPNEYEPDRFSDEAVGLSVT